MSLVTIVEWIYPGDTAVAWLGIVAAGVALLAAMAVMASRLRWLARRPAPRHAVLFSALVGGLVMPLLVALVAAAGLAIAVPVLPAREAVAGHDRPVAKAAAVSPMAPLPLPSRPGEVVRAGAVAEVEGHAAAFSPARASIVIGLVLWAMGSLVLFVGLARGIRLARRLRLSARPCDDPAVAAAATVLVAPDLATPVVVGIVRPVVILPAGLAGAISADELRDVLHHEMAHARRRDPLVVLLQGIARALYWPIVPVHLLNRELEQAREEICDNHVLRDRDPLSYGETLLHLAELATGLEARPLAASAGILHWRGKLESRIAGLLDASRSTATRTPRALAWGILAFFLGAGFLTASMRLVARGAEPEPQPPSPAAPAAKPEGRSILLKAVGPDGSPMPGVAIEADIVAEPAYRGDRRFVTDGQGQVRLALPGGIEDFTLRARADRCVPMVAEWRGVDRPSTLLMFKFTGFAYSGDGKISMMLPVEQERMEAESRREPLPAEFTFRMDRGSAIGGTIRDPEGRPIPGVRVEVRSLVYPERSRGRAMPDNQPATGEHAPRTGADGRWSFDGAPAGRWQVEGGPKGLRDPVFQILPSRAGHAVGADRDGLQALPGSPTMRALREQTAVLTMRPTAVVRGTVTDADGRPVPGAVVIPDLPPADLSAGGQAVKADDQGRFTLPPLASERQALWVVAEGWMPAKRVVDVGPGLEPLAIRLGRGKDLRIRFVDPAGKPVPGVDVSFNLWQGGNWLYIGTQAGYPDAKIPRQADGDGLYRWPWAPGEETLYVFSREGLQPQVTRLAADGQEHTVVLREGAAIKLK
ncbi:M56 family metallopeptidase [Aquisphaera insulae]|uniref:M56 family metallopeptidase n=1 Tax=Aquisphaera insulae TaxID=2712864 RepID=UPI0013EDEA3E|nr:M56 family metallopeptidase [Aquisphaera insulae]